MANLKMTSIMVDTQDLEVIERALDIIGDHLYDRLVDNECTDYDSDDDPDVQVEADLTAFRARIVRALGS